MPVSEAQIYSIISRALPDFSPRGELQPLIGGNLNHVWRLEGHPQNLIVKHAPPHIATNPEVPLCSDRIRFEAEALKLFERGNSLHKISSNQVRPPHLRHFDPDHNLLLMEDLRAFYSLTDWLVNKSDAFNIGSILGRFIGRLHTETYHKKQYKTTFRNQEIQKTRLRVQYQPAAQYAAQCGIADTKDLKLPTEQLGRKLLSPGCCLVMGDLWPPSVLISVGKIRLIDWEFAHYGRPLQDVAHFAAHCWMQAHTSSLKNNNLPFRKLWDHFWEGYRQADSLFPELFTDDEFNDASTHIGAEILGRAGGPFKKGYVYQDYEPRHPIIREAALKAQSLIRASDFSSLWD